MKEATGEVSMTVIVIVAVAVIGGILAIFWKPIKISIASAFAGTEEACQAISDDSDDNKISCSWDRGTGKCKCK